MKGESATSNNNSRVLQQQLCTRFQPVTPRFTHASQIWLKPTSSQTSTNGSPVATHTLHHNHVHPIRQNIFESIPKKMPTNVTCIRRNHQEKQPPSKRIRTQARLLTGQKQHFEQTWACTHAARLSKTKGFILRVSTFRIRSDIITVLFAITNE